MSFLVERSGQNWPWRAGTRRWFSASAGTAFRWLRRYSQRKRPTSRVDSRTL